MSIQSEINRLKQNVSAAFTAIGNKGGTVPNSKVSGNLASAINSIPEGVAVQRKTGTFTTDSNGIATVDCGFQPDYVVVRADGVTASDGSFYETNLTFPLCECQGLSEYLNTTAGSNRYVYIDAYMMALNSGFDIQLYQIGWDWAWSLISEESFDYVAIKYT
jgi:hypothetical protein